MDGEDLIDPPIRQGLIRQRELPWTWSRCSNVRHARLEAFIEGVSIELDTFEELVVVDAHRDGYYLDSITLDELVRKLSVRVRTQPDHSSTTGHGNSSALRMSVGTTPTGSIARGGVARGDTAAGATAVANR
jgi:hypothetical protein